MGNGYGGGGTFVEAGAEPDLGGRSVAMKMAKNMLLMCSTKVCGKLGI